MRLAVVAILGIADTKRGGQMIGIRRCAEAGTTRHETFHLASDSAAFTIAGEVDAWLRREGVSDELIPAIIEAMGQALADYMPPS
jgi:hypothetical protein